MYKEIISRKLFEYLQLKGIKVKKSLVSFECPFCKHNSAVVIPNAYLVNCYYCKPKDKLGHFYTIIDLVRKMENLQGTEEEILQYLKELLKVKVMTPIDEKNLEEYLDFYVKNGFDLVPIAKDKKNPIEQNWTNKTHQDKEEWKQWLANGLNIGLKTGTKSNVTIIDIDQKPIPEEIRKLMGTTLIQESSKGFHLIYKYDKDFPKTRIDKYKIDIENDGGQVVIYPSKVNGIERKLKLNIIIEMPKEFKDFLMNQVTIPRKTNSELIKEDIQTEEFKLKLFEEGSRNSSLIKLGGVFRKELNINQTNFVLNVLNKHNENPLPQKELNAMIRELDRYTAFDEKELAHKVLEYLKEVEEASRNEVAMAIVGTNRGENKKRIDTVLHYLVKEGYCFKRGNYYCIIKKADWKTELVQIGKPVDFKVPYFYDIANFKYKDMILIGSKNKYGKTHIAMNMVKQFAEQNVVVHYLSLEPTSRFAEIALQLGLKEGDFKWDWCVDPTQIELEPNAVTIIDWLCPKDFAKVDKLFMQFVEQLLKTNGLLIVFMQLKEDDSWFSPNLVNQFPALGAKYLYDNKGNGEYGKFIINPIRDPKIRAKIYEIPCKYDWETKELKRIIDIEDETTGN